MALQIKTLPAVIVTNPGQRKPLSSTRMLVYSMSVQSLASNTGTQYIGDSTVTSSNGQAFKAEDVVTLDSPPGGSREPEQFDLSEVYVDSSVAGAEFRISAWIRK